MDCIYIDPPYNTGNDKWLCMMWPRLQLLRELLAEDGVIFISIDDNEQHRLRMVMDEIWGKGISEMYSLCPESRKILENENK